MRGAAARLEEQRLTALEDYADVRLALGQDSSQIGELAELAAQHPTRERFHGLLMRALYRSGRQAEALEVYRSLRERVRDELGLDPGPELAALHQAILEQSPGLRRPAVVPAPAPHPAARTAHRARGPRRGPRRTGRAATHDPARDAHRHGSASARAASPWRPPTGSPATSPAARTWWNCHRSPRARTWPKPSRRHSAYATTAARGGGTRHDRRRRERDRARDDQRRRGRDRAGGARRNGGVDRRGFRRSPGSAGARQLRACGGGGGRACGAAAARWVRAVCDRHQPGASGRDRRSGAGGAAAGRMGGDAAVRRPGRRRAAGFRADGRGRRRRRGDLPPPRRHPAGAGAGRRPDAFAGRGGPGGAAGRPLPAAVGGTPDRPRPPADPQGGTRLELGAAHRARTRGAAPPGRPGGRLHAGGRRAGLRRASADRGSAARLRVGPRAGRRRRPAGPAGGPVADRTVGRQVPVAGVRGRVRAGAPARGRRARPRPELVRHLLHPARRVRGVVPERARAAPLDPAAGRRGRQPARRAGCRHEPGRHAADRAVHRLARLVLGAGSAG
ncbi:BTAD domain-containing putative transcriptional regulator [Nonomuraea ferruginea]